MAKLYPGGILIGTNFKISQANPVADYMVVSAKTDLTNTTILPYQFTGMTTFVVEDQNTYVLKNTGWEILGSGSSFTGGTVTGSTNFTNGLTATTISATTISLPYASGSTLFMGPTGQISQNNSQFFWDNVNNRLGLGTTAPTNKLTVSGSANITGSLTVGGSISATNGFSNLLPATTGGLLSIGNSGAYYWGTLYATGVNSPNTLTLTSTNNTVLNAGGAEAARIFDNGNFDIGNSTDSGYKLQISGITQTGSSANGLLDLAQTWNTTGVPTAIKLNVTSTASGANSLLMDLQVSTASKFNIDNTGIVRVQGTGDAAAYVMQLRDVTNSVALRLTNAGNSSSNLSFTQSTYTPINNAKANQAQLSGPAGGVVLQAVSTATTSTIDFVTNAFASAAASILAGRFTNPGNFLLGTAVDNGAKLQIQGTTASDGPTLGTELAISGTGTNWTGTAFSGGGYTHATGSTADLTTTLAATIGTYYQIAYTVTGRTSGSFAINYGGLSNSSLTATGTWGPVATSTAVLSITPTIDFSGTVILSVKTNSISIATTTFTNSSGTVVNEIRNANSNTNLFMGISTGRRVTTGTNNSFIGNNSGLANTTASNNTFLGTNAGAFNTTSSNNTFLGTSAGYSNISGPNNTFIGTSAGYSNTSGNNNTYIGQAAGLANITSISNTFIGTNAGNANIGNAGLGQNTGVGTFALDGNTTGTNNSVLGYGALRSNISGSNNVAIGGGAGRFVSGGTVAATSIGTSIFIGANAYPLADSQVNQIAIGNAAIGLGSNTTVLGNSSTVTSAIYGNLLLGTTNTTGDTTTKLQVSGAPGTTAVKIVGSGNSTTPPIFTIQGSQGELFSVNDSLTGSLFSVNDISGLPILEVFSDDTVLMGSYLAPSLNTTDKVTAGVGLTNIASIPTSTYTGAFFDYTINDGTNLRAGNIIGIWSGTTVQYTETSTNDIGNTSGLTFNMIITGSTAILRTSGITAGWTVKTIVRSI